MTTNTRQTILRANSLYLLAASLSGLLIDISGIFFSKGPENNIISAAPHAGVGFIEAHGLALIFSALLWRAEPLRRWHLTGLAVQFLLGTANLVFWEIFIAANFLFGGYLFTSLHWLFAILQLCSAIAAKENGAKPSGDRFDAAAPALCSEQELYLR